jgi:hypothetical protein
VVFFLIALIEAGAIIAFAEDKALATMACGAAGALAPAPAQPAVGAVPVPSSSDVTAPPSAASASGASSPAGSSATGDDAAQTSGDVRVQGDTNQIVDPKCVANAAVAALQASAPPAGPTCGPMKQPEALKAAEKQVSP